MTETDAAYLAGIIDGEGSINFQRNHFWSQGRNIVYNPRVRVTNTDKPLLDWICSVTGVGKVRAMKMYPSNRRQGYDWYVNGRKAAEILRPIIPYLKVKKRQAEIVLSYCETIIDLGNNHHGRNRVLTDEVLQLRQELIQKNWGLNTASNL